MPLQSPSLPYETFSIQVSEIRRPDNTYSVTVSWWTTIKALKEQLLQLTGVPPCKQHLFSSFLPMELRNTFTLHDLRIEKSGHSFSLVVDDSLSNFTLMAAHPSDLDESCLQMISDVKLGLNKNKVPGKSDLLDGTSGVYFMRSVLGANCAVFKPRDEEQGMPNNPKDHAGLGNIGLREHFKPGEGCLREQAAYIMDIDGFARVPPTTLVHCEHPSFHYPTSNGKQQSKPYPKYGSLQSFVKSESSFEDYGNNFFSDLEVQRIALLDMRLLNCDRNSANILVQRKSHHHSNIMDFQYEFHDEDLLFGTSTTAASHSMHNNSHEEYILIPIDHGYCMPRKVKIFEWDWAWIDYPQVSRPIHPEIKAYMEKMTAADIDNSINSLRKQLNFPEECYYLLRVVHTLIVNGISAGLTLRDIALIIARSDEDEPSEFEKALSVADEYAMRAAGVHVAGRVAVNSPTTSVTRKMSPDSVADNRDFKGMTEFVGTRLNAVCESHCDRSDSNSSSGEEEGSPSRSSTSNSSISMGNTRSISGFPNKNFSTSQSCVHLQSIAESEPAIGHLSPKSPPLSSATLSGQPLRTLHSEMGNRKSSAPPLSSLRVPMPSISLSNVFDARDEYSQPGKSEEALEADELRVDCSNDVGEDGGPKSSSSNNSWTNSGKFSTTSSSKETEELFPSLLPAPALTRVISFSGFESTPMFDGSSERTLSMLKREKHRQQISNIEYQRNRLRSVRHSMKMMIKKARGKSNMS